METLDKYGIKLQNILLPKTDINLKKWSIIACDQYTQDKTYWKKVKKRTKKVPSTAHLVFPENYLNYLSEGEANKKIEKINSTMKEYLSRDMFEVVGKLIYIKRKTKYGRTRKGIICCIDLEKYNWKNNAKSKIRSTEATVVERLPTRVEVRENALLDLPHIMLLVNDKDKILVESVGKYVKRKKIKPIYNFKLMMKSGKVKGYSIPEDYINSKLKDSFEKVYDKNTDSDGNTFMFAVGDGNHSLAAAKTVWENYKKEFVAFSGDNDFEKIKNHPLRYALVEIVNLYDEGLTFEPIHRILFNTDVNALFDFIKSKLDGKFFVCNSKEELLKKVSTSSSTFGFVTKKMGYLCFEASINCLAISAMQPILDEFLKSKNDIDYIHGSNELFELTSVDNSVGILFPPIEKESFFSTINTIGVLPRKSFSMGEASEKRFYLECRSLRGAKKYH